MANAYGLEARKQRRRLLLLLVPVLLAVAVLANWTDIQKIMKGEKSARSILYGVSGKAKGGTGGWKLPPNSGAPNARVKIEVFVTEGDSCQSGTAFLGRALGTVDPKRVKVEFVNGLTGAKAAARREAVKLGCEQGLAINGKTEFKIPSAQPGGKPETVFLTQHATGGMSLPKLYAMVNQEVKAAYHGKGLAMTAAEFETKVTAEVGHAKDIAAAQGSSAGKTGPPPGSRGPMSPPPGPSPHH
jgi:hypothetical protein